MIKGMTYRVMIPVILAHQHRQTGDGVIWPKSEACVRRMLIWKNEIKGKDQKFGSAEAFRYNMRKYAIVHRFDYVFMRNYRRQIVVRCKVEDCGFFHLFKGQKKVDGMVMKHFRREHNHSVKN